jgi:N-acetylmuramoyl-L-alanine amidase
VPYGPYRVKATFRDGDGVLTRSAWITRARRVPYPARPGAITVALDPGHGGPAAGAVWKGLPEDRVNLDIGRRLEAMLKGAGVGVVMTRRTDRNVSPVGKDLNGDRRYTRLDELLARNDIANQHRADIHLALHNNASTCHCRRGTEMYTHFGRSWTPEGRKLARALLREHLWHLERIPGFKPRNRGVKSHDFKALKPYHPVRMPRPSLQPSVLGESLFLDRPSEHKVLRSRAGRNAIAAAYFDGIARYLAVRPYGLRYEILEATRRARPGASAEVRVRLTNTGHRTSSGWRVVARVVKQVRRYDGRPRLGQVVARTPIPDGLAPGETVEVRLPVIPLPESAGSWLLKLDVDLPGGDALARHGVVGPQIRVQTVSP